MEVDPLVGQLLDKRYEVTRRIGGGGMGSVYEAQHAGTGRRVAIKVISTGDVLKDAALVGRFQREAKAAGAIDTQHICQVLDTGTDPDSGLPFMVMEYMTGEDVQQLFQRVGTVSCDLNLRIIAQSCLGLAKAHEVGVVHRDIKPANLFLAQRDGDEVLIKLLDFGIAKVKMDQASSTADAGLTRTGTMLGSPLYMSPEQARGSKNIDHRADLWSLGIVLYQGLTGRTPYHHIDALGELIIAICSEPPRSVQDFAPWVPKDVAYIVHKALRADPNERFQSAQEMLDAVKKLLPNGNSVTQAMLVPISDAEKGNVSSRISMAPPPQLRVSIPSAYPRALDAALEAQGGGASRVATTSAGTNDGVATERAPDRTGSNMKFVVAGAVLTVAALGFGAYKFMGANGQNAPAAPVSAAPAPVTTTPAVVSVQVTPASAVAPVVVTPDEKERTVRVVVIPEDSTVTVDGVAAPVENGFVELKGKLGDTRKVRITAKSGKPSADGIVSITSDGAYPPKIELDLKNGGALPFKGPPPPGGAPSTATPITPKGIATSFGD